MTAATLFTLFIVLRDPAYNNLTPYRINSFPDKATCMMTGSAFGPNVIWHCEPGPPPKGCPAVS